MNETSRERVGPRLRPARSAVLIATALVIASGLWVAVRASLPTDGAPVLTDGGYANGFTVDPGASDPTPLRKGDVVVGIEGITIDDVLRRTDHATPRLRAGETWRYDVLRDGNTREVEVRLRDGGFVRERLRDAASVLFVAVLLLALGAWATFRQPDHAAARALLLLGAGFVSYNTFQALSIDVTALPAARLLFAAGIAGHVGSLAIWMTALALLALSFPEPVELLDRHPLVSRVGLGGVFAATAGLQGGLIASGLANRQTLNASYIGMQAALWVLAVATLVGLARTIWRAVGDPSARRQGGLVVLGMTTSLLVVIATNLFVPDEALPPWFAALAFLPMPAAVAVAIVRGEFLDLRATINRTLVFTSLAGILLGTYALVVVAIGAVVGDSGLAATIPATGVVALALAPLRSALQQGVDRVVYGDRGDPARVLTELGRRLDAALPAEQILAVVADTLATSLRLPYIGIRTVGDSANRLVFERGDPTTTAEIVPLHRHGRLVGELVVAPRRGQRSLTADDRALLADVARQIATAVDASRLVTELAASRSAIAVAREEERAQLRHDLHDRLGSHLVGLSLKLETLEPGSSNPPDPDAAQQAQAEVRHVLEEVRRISRGLRPAELDELGLGAAIEAIRATAERGRQRRLDS